MANSTATFSHVEELLADGFATVVKAVVGLIATVVVSVMLSVVKYVQQSEKQVEEYRTTNQKKLAAAAEHGEMLRKQSILFASARIGSDTTGSPSASDDTQEGGKEK